MCSDVEGEITSSDVTTEKTDTDSSSRKRRHVDVSESGDACLSAKQHKHSCSPKKKNDCKQETLTSIYGGVSTDKKTIQQSSTSSGLASYLLAQHSAGTCSSTTHKTSMTSSSITTAKHCADTKCPSADARCPSADDRCPSADDDGCPSMDGRYFSADVRQGEYNCSDDKLFEDMCNFSSFDNFEDDV